jgi:phosphate transport system substrate-binding protein
MSTKSLIIRSIIYIILLGVFVFGYGFALLAATFARESGWQTYCIALVGIWFSGSLLLAASAYGVATRRRLGAFWLIFLALNIACHAPYYGYTYHKGKLAVVDTYIDIDDYLPFSEGNILAKLDEPASFSFSLEDDLPVLDGSTALYPLYAAFAESVYPKDAPSAGFDQHPYSLYGDGVVRCTRTQGSYEALVDGDADLIFVPMASDEQLAYATEKGMELEFTPIGKEAFVFLVNAKNPVSNLSTEQIKDIYTGDITNWRKVGGKNDHIRAFQRNLGSGSQTAFIRFMDGNIPMTAPTTEYVDIMSGVVNEVADYRNHKNAIGYSFHFFITSMAGSDKIKLLSVDGIAPKAANIATGEYPLVSNFYAVRIKGKSKPNTEKLVNWILSPEGQELVEKTGYFVRP